MHRTVIDFGAIAIRSYGVMLVIAFWLGIELTARSAKRRGLDPTKILDMGLVVLVASLVGSRLFYVLTHWSEYQADKIAVLRVWEGGLTFYGGLACAIFFGMAYLRWKRMPVLEVTDIAAPQIALGIAIARVGCFLNGCCFGKASTLPWACTFPPDSQAGWVMAGRPVHPTQIYESIANVVIFLVLRRVLARGHPRGVVFFAFLALYGSWRFGIDYLRYYEAAMYLGPVGITWNQLVSLAMVATGLILGLAAIRQGKRDAQA
jgi:phosphatidylglycerol---prolipoprotein diacylglyceryl transferase